MNVSVIKLHNLDCECYQLLSLDFQIVLQIIKYGSYGKTMERLLITMVYALTWIFHFSYKTVVLPTGMNSAMCF